MATYYVRSSGGNDTNDGLSFANAFATIQKAADTATAGDDVRICADGTHTQTATIDLDTNSGTGASPIVFTGANGTDGSDDGTVATVNRTSFGAAVFVGNGTVSHIHFRNISSQNDNRPFVSTVPYAVIESVECSGSTTLVCETCAGAVLRKCSLSGTAAVSLVTGNRGEVCIDCYVDASSSIFSTAILEVSNFRASARYKRVTVAGATLGASFDNSDAVASGVLDSCIFDGCTTGVSVLQDDVPLITSCTFYNCTTGIDASAAAATGTLVVEDCIFKDCTEGIEIGASPATFLIERRNVFHGNTRNISSDTTEQGVHSSSTTATDPAFSNAAGGNFTVTASGLIQRSVAWEDGVNTSYLDAGAVQSQVAAGGGGASGSPLQSPFIRV